MTRACGTRRRGLFATICRSKADGVLSWFSEDGGAQETTRERQEEANIDIVSKQGKGRRKEEMGRGV